MCPGTGRGALTVPRVRGSLFLSFSEACVPRDLLVVFVSVRILYSNQWPH